MGRRTSARNPPKATASVSPRLARQTRASTRRGQTPTLSTGLPTRQTRSSTKRNRAPTASPPPPAKRIRTSNSPTDPEDVVCESLHSGDAETAHSDEEDPEPQDTGSEPQEFLNHRCDWKACTYSTDSQFEMDKHTEIHKNCKNRRHQCIYTWCPWGFNKSWDLRNHHEGEQHPNGENPSKIQTCNFSPTPQCGFRTNFPSEWKKHMEQHEKYLYMTYQCRYENCPYGYMDPSAMRRHEIKHPSDEKEKDPTLAPDLFCDFSSGCPYITKSHAEMKQHVKEHERCKDMPLQCSVEGCPYGADKPKAMKYHQRTKHDPDDEDNGYKCGNCGKSLSLDGLRKHQKTIHSGEEIKTPFSCPVTDCPERFASRKELRDHEKRHSEGKPLLCHFCGVLLPDLAALLFHRRTEHPTGGSKIAIKKKMSYRIQATASRLEVEYGSLHPHTGIGFSSMQKPAGAWDGLLCESHPKKCLYCRERLQNPTDQDFADHKAQCKLKLMRQRKEALKTITAHCAHIQAVDDAPCENPRDPGTPFCAVHHPSRKESRNNTIEQKNKFRSVLNSMKTLPAAYDPILRMVMQCIYDLKQITPETLMTIDEEVSLTTEVIWQFSMKDGNGKDVIKPTAIDYGMSREELKSRELEQVLGFSMSNTIVENMIDKIYLEVEEGNMRLRTWSQVGEELQDYVDEHGPISAILDWGPNGIDYRALKSALDNVGKGHLLPKQLKPTFSPLYWFRELRRRTPVLKGLFLGLSCIFSILYPEQKYLASLAHWADADVAMTIQVMEFIFKRLDGELCQSKIYRYLRSKVEKEESVMESKEEKKERVVKSKEELLKELEQFMVAVDEVDYEFDDEVDYESDDEVDDEFDNEETDEQSDNFDHEGRWTKIPTSGTNLECALHAISLSYSHQPHPESDIPGPTVDQLREIVQSSEYQAQLLAFPDGENENENGQQGARNLRFDQASLLLQLWGQERGLHLRLGVWIPSQAQKWIAPSHTDPGEVHTIWVHNNEIDASSDNTINHYSGLRPKQGLQSIDPYLLCLPEGQ